MGNLFDGGGVLNGLSLNVVGIAATCWASPFIMLSFYRGLSGLLKCKNRKGADFRVLRIVSDSCLVLQVYGTRTKMYRSI